MGDATLVGVAIERYERSFVANWQLTIGRVENHPYPEYEFAAEDDRGNRYRGFPAGGSGGSSPGGPFEGQQAARFVPALAPDARALRLTCLARRDADTTLGPWEFAVEVPPLPGG